jgi:predicted nucleic-acid-binding protein
MTKYVLDTNVMLRFLLGDHPTLSPEAKAIFEEAQSGKITLVVSELLIAEAVWVLSSYYKVSKSDIVKQLTSVIKMAGIIALGKERIVAALERFEKTSCDYVDCYFGALSVEKGHAVISFDSHFHKMPDVTLKERRQISN